MMVGKGACETGGQLLTAAAAASVEETMNAARHDQREKLSHAKHVRGPAPKSSVAMVNTAAGQTGLGLGNDEW